MPSSDVTVICEFFPLFHWLHFASFRPFCLTRSLHLLFFVSYPPPPTLKQKMFLTNNGRPFCFLKTERRDTLQGFIVDYGVESKYLNK